MDATKRKVNVQVILDKSQRTDKYSSADFLAHAGVPTRIDSKHGIAHNKVMVIDRAAVITGSMNFTKAGETSNAENVLVIRDAPLTIFDAISSCRSNASHSWQAIALTAGAVPWVCKGAAAQTAPLFKCVDSTSAEQFGIGSAGQIRTNQSSNATTPGSVVKKLQVFDSSGNSLGYIPIYDAIT